MHLPVAVHRHPRARDHPDRREPGRRSGLRADGTSSLVVTNTTRGTTIGQSVAAASSFWDRFRGLMARTSLEPHDGLWLPDTSSIHMMFMRFPIDCAFLSKPDATGSRRVVAVRHVLPPWRGVVWWVRGAGGVVELPAGALAASGTEPGDTVELRAA